LCHVITLLILYFLVTPSLLKIQNWGLPLLFELIAVAL